MIGKKPKELLSRERWKTGLRRRFTEDAKNSHGPRDRQGVEGVGEVRGHGDSGTMALTSDWLPPVILGWLPDKDGPILAN